MILIDLNVLLDVLQKREPHYRASAAVLEKVIRQDEKGFLAAHALTTAHYLVSRFQNRKKADQVIEWLLKYFDIAAVGRDELIRARQLGWSDLEDAVVACAAKSANCQALVARNVKDFRNSPVAALTPGEYLLQSESNFDKIQEKQVPGYGP
ncbi:MAG: PIN domain-containing protein [Cellvibrionaceae bacterium]